MLKQHAGLSDDVTFMGLGRVFQIWELARPSKGGKKPVYAPAPRPRSAPLHPSRSRTHDDVPLPPRVRMQAIPQFEGHNPVMLREVLTLLQIQSRGTYLDGTFGGGGYARAMMAEAPAHLFALDKDPDAITRGQALQDHFAVNDRRAAPTFEIRQGNFRDMATLFADVAPFDGIVLDLGVSSFQIDQAERGFSFRQDGPLDMRMAQSGQSAADLVNHADEATLADIIYHYGEERLARRVASAIVAARQEEPIHRTRQLAAIIRKVVHPDRSRIDPATRTFQAIRIAVNDEMNDLERVLETAPGLLREGDALWWSPSIRWRIAS